jgi:hypothetical protein
MPTEPSLPRSAALSENELASLESGSPFLVSNVYRSVFEKGFEVLRFEPDAAELAEGVALALSVEVLGKDEGAADFADAVARLIAARPLALIAEI